MSKPNLSSVYAGLATNRGSVQVHLQDIHSLGNGYHKVIAAVSGIHNESQFGQAIADLTDGGARLVSGSTVQKGRIVVGMIKGNARSKPIDESFRMVSSCTASDMSGTIWNVVDDGSGKRVVLESADDLDALLKLRVANRREVANPVEGRGLATASWDNGDVIRYVDTDNGSVNCALAFSTEEGIKALHSDGKYKTITHGSIMESVPAKRVNASLHALQAECAGTQLSPAELEKAIAFLSKAGVLSDEMATRMRSLSNTPTAGA